MKCNIQDKLQITIRFNIQMRMWLLSCIIDKVYFNKSDGQNIPKAMGIDNGKEFH